jgi:hypothetical protein
LGFLLCSNFYRKRKTKESKIFYFGLLDFLDLFSCPSQPFFYNQHWRESSAEHGDSTFPLIPFFFSFFGIVLSVVLPATLRLLKT